MCSNCSGDYEDPEAPTPESQADLLEEESPALKVCLKHAWTGKAVYFDGPHCPACQAESEFLDLTSDIG